MNKYQIVEAVITRDNEIIPIWDARLEFFKDGDINKGSKLESHWKKSFKDVIFQDNLIYAIKQWKPTYVLDDGTRIKYTHQMFHLL